VGAGISVDGELDGGPIEGAPDDKSGCTEPT
jgi:hypothetical protein